MTRQTMEYAVEATVTEADTYTLGIFVSYEGEEAGLNISVWGDAEWSATVTLERRFSSTGTWMAVKQYTYADAVEHSIQEQLADWEKAAQYRIGVAAGDYSSGTINLRLGR